MRSSLNALACALALPLAVDAADRAAPDRLPLRASVAAAHTIVRGTWIAEPSGDYVRVTETLEGAWQGDELRCRTGSERAPAVESILVLQMTTASSCTLIGSTGTSRQPQVIYLIGQTRFARGDYAGAAQAWRAAMNDGPLDAYNNLGYLLHAGMGVVRDDAEAVRLWRYAAERGIPESMIHLASAYLEGRGVPRDLAEALAWARGGAKFDGRLADHAIAESIGKQADRVTTRILKLASPAQKKEGERRALLKAERVDAYWSQRLR